MRTGWSWLLLLDVGSVAPVQFFPTTPVLNRVVFHRDRFAQLEYGRLAAEEEAEEEEEVLLGDSDFASGMDLDLCSNTSKEAPF
eukprot:SAG31_NODE_3352_length_4370_cov_3.025749_2_plen_84_part_00